MAFKVTAQTEFGQASIYAYPSNTDCGMVEVGAPIWPDEMVFDTAYGDDARVDLRGDFSKSSDDVLRGVDYLLFADEEQGWHIGELLQLVVGQHGGRDRHFHLEASQSHESVLQHFLRQLTAGLVVAFGQHREHPAHHVPKKVAVGQHGGEAVPGPGSRQLLDRGRRCEQYCGLQAAGKAQGVLAGQPGAV